MRRKIIRTAAAVATAALALSGCANGDSAESSANNDELTELSVGYIPAGVYAYFWQAEEAGYFAEEGLSIELMPMAGGSEIIPALQSDTVQFGISDAMGLLNARNQDIDVKYAKFNAGQEAVSPIHSVVVADDSLSDPSDLNGKTVATNSTYNTDWIMMRQWLIEGGADLDSIEFVEMGFTDQLAALRAGSIDAAGMLEPFVATAENEGLHIIGDYFTDVESPIAVSGVLVMDDYAEENPEVVSGFVTAIDRAVDDFTEDSDVARSVIEANTEIDSEIVQTMNLPTWSNDLDADSMQFWIDAAMGEGLIDGEVDTSELIWQP